MTETKRRGYSIVELLVVLGVIAAAVLFIAGITGTATSAQLVDQAYNEVQLLKMAAQSYRRAPAQAGTYAGISISVLNSNGYNQPFTTGTNQNAYGLSVTLAPAGAGGADATITYATEDTESCNQLRQRFLNTAGVKTLPLCTAGSLVMTLE